MNWTIAKSRRLLAAALVVVASASAVQAAETVTVSNFVRAETDKYFASVIAVTGAPGQFQHYRQPIPVENQQVIRMNRDTLYSAAVFDLTTPVTIVKPESDGRFQSMLVINQDHYVVGVEHGAGEFTLTREDVGTRYVITIFRTFVDPTSPEGIARANALQDGLEARQADPGTFEIPDWDPASLDAVRNALNALVPMMGDESRKFGSRDEVDPIQHLFFTASGWGGNPPAAAVYVTVVPEQNDGKTRYALTARDVPVDGFASVTVYNAEGYLEPNPFDAYAFNNLTAAKNEDGSVTIHFGGCEDGRINCLPTPPGWNYAVRLYQPRAEILDGSWAFPEAVVVE
jgi:hypothetical protein